eukprot:5235150-Amphidinium_carterae.1
MEGRGHLNGKDLAREKGLAREKDLEKEKDQEAETKVPTGRGQAAGVQHVNERRAETGTTRARTTLHL